MAKKTGKWDNWSWEDAFQVSERELVNPKLSRWDKSDLYDLLVVRDLRKHCADKNIQPYAAMSDVDFEAAVEKVFPKYMLYDTYNINHTPTENIKLANTDENNKWLFDFLMNKATGYYSKTVTQQNPFNSYVYSSEIMKQLFDIYQQENPQGPGDGDGEGKDGKGQSGMQKMLSKMQSNSKGNQKLDKAMDQAQQKADERIKDADDTGNATGDLGCDKSMGDFSLGELSEFMNYMEALDNIELPESVVTSFVKNTLKLSEAYFSTKYTESQVELLEADVIDDLSNIEYLFPQLRALGLDNIVTHERKYHMKFDLFVDISGSMSSQIYDVKGNGSIAGIDLAKITALKLKNMGHVEDVYPFQSRVEKKLTKKSDIALMKCTGGTDINEVIRTVQKTDRPSVVITDMQDSISIYDPNVFFVGILGATFENFRGQTIGKQYIENRQCIKYDNTNKFVLVQ